MSCSTESPAPASQLVTIVARRPKRAAALIAASAGIGYLLVWVVGLSVWPNNLALNASPAQVAATISRHAAAAATQYLLVEGAAGVLLGVVLWSMLSAGQHKWLLLRTPVIALTATVAIAVSLVQCGLGLALVAAAHSEHIARSGELFGLVNRLDGLKMVALAIVAAWAARTGDTTTPRWLRVVAAFLSISLLISGAAYLLLAAGIAAWAVFISGPLLLLWATSTGLWIARSSKVATNA